jgi:MFS family permease
VWFTPIFPVSGWMKGALFIFFLLSGHIISNILMPAKTNWFMSLVDDRKRGVFTANKEIVSLLSGMVFSYVMGALYDYFEISGQTTAAMITGGAAISGLMILHTLTLIFSEEKPVEKTEKTSIRSFFADRNQTKIIFLVIGINILWAVAHYVSTPFYGTYQVKELGFSMTFVSVLGILYAVFRSVFSRFLGRFADKHSFASMLNICFSLVAVAFLVNTFTVPENGKILFTVYYVLYAVSMGGLNSAAINLIYDYVAPEQRTVALAFSQSLSGIVGFLTTFLAGFFVDWIQSSGGLFGLRIYAQQAVSFLSFLLVLFSLLYVNTVVRKLPKRKE